VKQHSAGTWHLRPSRDHRVPTEQAGPLHARIWRYLEFGWATTAYDLTVSHAIAHARRHDAAPPAASPGTAGSRSDPRARRPDAGPSDIPEGRR
jgi:hypothetical protein